jgi:23S rRNA (cytidine1920-2'-O)/16S rRNA (cytidine1409-2'-O)-methyltransferase
VSRGAFKIEKAFAEFGIDPNGLRVADVGISTGGFSDFMLQNGVRNIVGIDVNTRQVDEKIRNDDRVVLLQKNARHLERKDLPFLPDLFTIDVSFISVLKILPALSQFQEARILALIKPQFEAPRGRVGKGGVVKKQEQIDRILDAVGGKIEGLGFRILAATEAGIRGRRGNQEYFFLIESGKTAAIDDKI